MAFKPPVAVYDSCVLYPFEVRNLLVQFAFDRLVEARWTDEIHDEWIRNLVETTPGLTRSRLERTRDLMKQAVPSADVVGYQRHIPAITLPDPDDRHVVAAGIAGGASVIVTWNLKEFPALELSSMDWRLNHLTRLRAISTRPIRCWWRHPSGTHGRTCGSPNRRPRNICRSLDGATSPDSRRRCGNIGARSEIR